MTHYDQWNCRDSKFVMKEVIMWESIRCVHVMRTDLLQFEPLTVISYNLFYYYHYY